jgi:hypothetical protein
MHRVRFWRVVAVIVLPATLVACTSHVPRRSAASSPASRVSPTVSATVSAQSTTPIVASYAPPPSPSTDVVGGSTWGGHILVITGHSLGGVTIGMSSAAAAHAAGVSAFTSVGDGVLQPAGPLGSSQLRLYLGNFAGQPASSVGGDFSCVAAAGSASGLLSVVTTLGLRLGDPAARVREIYGAAANFVPMPCNG